MSTAENRLRIIFNRIFRDAALIVNPGERTFLLLEDLINTELINLLRLVDPMVPWIQIDGSLLVAETPLGTIRLDFDHVVLSYNSIQGTVGVELGAFPPEIADLPRLSLSEGVPFAFDVAPHLDYGAPLAALFSTIPSWVTRTGTIFSGTPPDLARARTEEILLELINTQGEDTGTLYLDISNTLVPRPVTIRTIPLQTGNEFEMFTFDASPFLVQGHPPGMFEWTAVPDWATTRHTFVEGIIPDQTQSTDWAFRFRWYNDNSDASATVTLRVGDTHFAPVWQPIPDQTAILTQGYSLNLNNFVSGGPNAPVVTVLDVVDGYSESGGVFSGFGTAAIPTQAVRARATNSQGSTDTTFMFTAIPLDQAPSISTIPQQFLNEGDTLKFDVEPFLDRGFPTATLLATFPSWVTQAGSVFSGTVPNRGMDIQEQIQLVLANAIGSATGNVELVIGNTLFPPRWQAIRVQEVSQGTPHTLNANNFVTGGPRPVISAPSGLPVGFTLVDGNLSTDGTLFGIHRITLLATNSEGEDTTTAEFRIEPDVAGDFPIQTGGNLFGITYNGSEFFLLRHDQHFDVHSRGGLYLRTFPLPEAHTPDHPNVTAAPTSNETGLVYAMNSRLGAYAYRSTGEYADTGLFPAHVLPEDIGSVPLVFINGTRIAILSRTGNMSQYGPGEDPFFLFTVQGYDPDDAGTLIDASVFAGGYFWIIRRNREMVVTDFEGNVFPEVAIDASRIPSNQTPQGATAAAGGLYIATLQGNVYRFDVPFAAPMWNTDAVANVFPNREVRINLSDFVAHHGVPNPEVTALGALPEGFSLEGNRNRTLVINADAGTYQVPLRISNSQGFDDRTFDFSIAYPTEYPFSSAFFARGITYLNGQFYTADFSGFLNRVDPVTGVRTFIGRDPTYENYVGITTDGTSLYLFRDANEDFIVGVSEMDGALLPNMRIDVPLSTYEGMMVYAENRFRILDSDSTLLAIQDNGLRDSTREFSVPRFSSSQPNTFGRGLAYVDVGVGFFYYINYHGVARVYDSNGMERTSLNETFTTIDAPNVDGAVYALDALYLWERNGRTIYRKEIFEAPAFDPIGPVSVVEDTPYTLSVFDSLNTELVELTQLTTSDGITFDPDTGIITIQLTDGAASTSIRARNPAGEDVLHVSASVTIPFTSIPLHPENTDSQGIDFYAGYHYVLDGAGNRIFVYDQAGNRVPSREVALDATLFDGFARGITTVGNLAYISKAEPNSSLYVWNLDTQTRQTSSEFPVQGIIQGVEHIQNNGTDILLVTRVQSNFQYVTLYSLSGVTVSNTPNPVLLSTSLIRGIAYESTSDPDVIYGAGTDGRIYAYDENLDRLTAIEFAAADIRGLHYRADRLWGVDATHIRSWADPTVPIPDSFPLPFDPAGIVGVPGRGLYIGHNDAERIENTDYHGNLRAENEINYHVLTDVVVALAYGNNRIYAGDNEDRRIYVYSLNNVFHIEETILTSVDVYEFFYYNDRLYNGHREVNQSNGIDVYLRAIMLDGTEDPSREIDLGFFQFVTHLTPTTGDESIESISYFNGRVYVVVREILEDIVPPFTETQLRAYTIDANYVATEVMSERVILQPRSHSNPHFRAHLAFLENPRKMYAYTRNRIITIFDY